MVYITMKYIYLFLLILISFISESFFIYFTMPLISGWLIYLFIQLIAFILRRPLNYYQDE